MVTWIQTPVWEILASDSQQLMDRHGSEFALFLSSSRSACSWLLGCEPFLYVCLNITDLCIFFLEALFDSMIGSQIPGDPFMSQRILSSSSLPLRQRSDKPPWCECAPFLIGVNVMVREGIKEC